MTDQKAESSQIVQAQQTQEKFDFYLLALSFTVLAFSIQTATFGTERTADLLELMGWLLLSISGFVGLWRMEWIPIIRLQEAYKNRLERDISEIQKRRLEGSSLVALHDGSPLTYDEQIQSLKQDVERLSKQIGSLHPQNQLKYKIHRWSFALGLLCVVGARAYVPVNSSFC